MLRWSGQIATAGHATGYALAGDELLEGEPHRVLDRNLADPGAVGLDDDAVAGVEHDVAHVLRVAGARGEDQVRWLQVLGPDGAGSQRLLVRVAGDVHAAGAVAEVDESQQSGASGERPPHR